MHYQFYASRRQTVSLLLVGFGLIMVGLSLVLMASTDKWWLTLIGIALVLLGLAAQLHLLHRRLTHPVALDIGPEGITYRHSTFSNKKSIRLPWQNIRDVQLGGISYTNYDTNHALPLKIDTITILVTDGLLKSYGTFNDNVFITDNQLRINTSSLQKFDGQYLLAGLKANHVTDS